MTFLKKILDLFGKNTESDSGKDYQAQSKPTTTTIDITPSHNDKNLLMQTGTFDVIVVGVSFYQAALKKICSNKHEEGADLLVQANIVPYNDNPHDANAVSLGEWGQVLQ